MTDTKTTSKRTRAARTPNVWTDEERAAMQESARERKAASRRGPGDERAEGERELRAKIAAMPQPDRAMAERIHGLVTDSAPDLVPRYSTFGFQPDARVDDGEMWPVAFAVTKLTAGVEARLADLVKKAAG